MAVVVTATVEISGSVAGSFTSLVAVATESGTAAEPLVLTDTDSSSIGVYNITTQLSQNLTNT